MKWIRGSLVWVILALFTLSGASAAPQEALLWRNQTVDADVRGMELPALLKEIAAHTGWQIYVEPGLTPPISAKFHKLPLNAALKALFGNLNFALLPQTNGPSKLYVFETNLQEATQIIQAPPGARGRDAGVIPNELVVTLKEGAKIEALAQSLGAKVAGAMSRQGTYRLEFEDEAAAEKARDTLRGNSQVLGVESNYLVERPTRTESLALTSGLPSTSKARAAAGDGKIIIGLIDTIVQRQGTPLGEGVLMPSVSVAGEVKPPTDYPTHGTSMSETLLQGYNLAAQSQSEALGAIRILPVDIYGGSGATTTFEVAAGIDAAVRRGAGIINLSLGSEGNSPFLQRVIAAAHKDGVMFFAAAGNEPSTAAVYPAAYPEVVAVTAGDRKGEVAGYANRGAFVDVSAPGSSIVYFNGQPYVVTGTSAATAYVSGIAAGMAAASKKPLGEVEKQIRQTLAIKER